MKTLDVVHVVQECAEAVSGFLKVSVVA